MIRKIGIAAMLLVAGVGIAMYLRSGPAPEKTEQVFTPRTGVSDAERIADLERALAAQVDRGNLLDSRLKELEGRFGNFGGNRRNNNANNADSNNQQQREQRTAEMRQRMGDIFDANGNIDQAKLRERQREQRLDRLVQAGLSRERAEWVDRRTQELEVQAQQAQFDAQRTGQQYRRVDTEATLRKEMGDAEYEKYLTGTGRSTEVQVREVLASSAAERAGLRPGDQIVSYAGTRVFSTGDLTSLTRQGTPGETVAVEVQRNGQTMQLTVPRGVLGVEAGGGGQRSGFGGNRGNFNGGPPGGFNGGGGRPGGGRPGG